ncbi:MAG: and RNA helicase protein [Microgenomates group bacterium GW2011_GWC1_39_7]|nr:MAG: and RNA helicase protein [Microgenomates group bacterium GW2011_GWC1_39_7]
MELVLDLHLHSRFSRAVSQRMNLRNMYIWARKKGINILSVTDFTHPIWFREAKSQLEELNPGIFRLKDQKKADLELGSLSQKDFLGPYFMLSTEVSSIYSENGVPHRIHLLIFSPNLETAEKINTALIKRGCNLSSDGRPILGIPSRELAAILFNIDRKIAIIPCHVWTPWFSLYGSRSGYDRLADCFGEYSKYIFAVETGLSSDPAMNWRINELDSRSIVSFSDAHSLEKMGREATVLRKKNGMSNVKFPISNNPIKTEDIAYDNILNSFVRGKERVFEIAYTIEFYPEEGKYHYTGHRLCKVSYSPSDDKTKGTICPVCKKPLTVGVMHRVEELATKESNNFKPGEDEFGVVWIKDAKDMRPPYVALVPLLEVLAESLSSGVGSQGVLSLFDRLINHFGSEHEVLFRIPVSEIREVGGDRIAKGIEKVRARNIKIVPGFDGEYGKVAIWNNEEDSKTSSEKTQLGLKY